MSEKLRILEEMKIFTKIVYNSAKLFPKTEQFNLISQTQRCVISVRLNIREGNVFRGNKKLNFFLIAKGSLEELDECMQIAYELEYINLNEIQIFKEQYNLIYNMLNKLIHSYTLILNA